MAAGKKPAKPRLTPEQKRAKDYEQARAMESWVAWAGSWKDRAELCEQAAAAYEKLGEYQDCPQRRAGLEEQRRRALSGERDEAFAALRQELERAKTAQDLYYVGEKLERYENLSEAKTLRKEVRRRRKELLGRRRLVKRLSLGAVCVLLVLMAALVRIHVPQYVLGRAFQAVGQYNHALSWYNRSGSFADTRDRKTFCRYQRGLYFQEQGKYSAAYQKFRETKDYEDSRERCVACVLALLRETEAGKKVKFGKTGSEFPEWIVLENDGEQVTLMAEFSEARAFDSMGRDWTESDIHTWLNTEFLNGYFLDFEQDLLVNPTGEGEGPVYLLSVEEYEHYAPVLTGLKDDGKAVDGFKIPAQGYWLRTASEHAGGQVIVRAANEADLYGVSRTLDLPHVRPVITVSLTQS